ncbi:MAG: hypothetical protein FWB71_02005, partial [Defluviitaleaceae bacterium]|nr:hypothetical protein [Defluviitaleaceae bacterium]
MNAVLAGLFGILGQFGEGVFAPGQGGRLVGIVKDLISTDYDHPDMPFLMFCAILREACERDAFAAFARAGADRAPDIAEEITRRLFADMGMDRAACGEVLGMIAALAGV